MNLFVLVVIFCISWFAITMLTTIVHEFGHAVAAYLITKEKVTLYLGSYGEEHKSKKIVLGRFEIWVRKNIFLWRGGLCKSSASFSTRQMFIYILAGPVASLLLFTVFLLCMLLLRPEGLLGGLLLVSCVWSGLVFLYNIVPRSNVIKMNGGEINYNDGTHLKILLDKKKMPAGYDEALLQFKAGSFADCVDVFDQIIRNGTKNPEVYRCAVFAHINLRNFRRADEVQKEQVAKLGNLNAHDRISMAILKTHLGKYQEAIDYYRHLLITGGDNKYNLTNFGYTLSLLDRHEEAIENLDKAILIDNNFAEAYANRAYAKLKMRLLEDGKQDNDRALELDQRNVFAHRNAGIYYFEREKFDLAFKHFEIASEADPDMPYLNDYLFQAGRKLQENNTD